MAFLEVVGELFGFSDNKGWELVSQDLASDLTFKGQFISENMRDGVGAIINSSQALNQQAPSKSYGGGENEIFTFTSKLFANNSFKNIKQQIETLKSMAKRNKELRRPPIFLFTAGTEISFTCFVKGIGFNIGELRSDGSLRDADISITLEKILEQVTGNAATSLASQIKFAAGIVAGAAGIFAQASKLINIPGGSLHTIDKTKRVIDGDTFESIAAAEYGDALLGDILRRAQPELADLKSNDVVQLVEATEINQIAITQQSVALKNTPENLALREEFLELRNRKTTIFV